ncbi:MAG TPA: hypothetical protein VLS28_10080 [Candidatus Sulfomarinibacteraceae bacterium]|nr:hypothetical protein [Candidatus Sulfomarinibacteraceae bacterium]
MTRLAAILDERRLSYVAVASRANLQPRTVRQLATGETPIDQASVGTVRRIAAALSVPVAALIDLDAVRPGDPTLSRSARLSAAVRDMVGSGARIGYPSPVEAVEADSIAAVPPEEFFSAMPAIDDHRS